MHSLDKALLGLAGAIGLLFLLLQLLPPLPEGNPGKNPELAVAAGFLAKVVFYALGVPMLYIFWTYLVYLFLLLVAVRLFLSIRQFLRDKDAELNRPRR